MIELRIETKLGCEINLRIEIQFGLEIKLRIDMNPIKIENALDINLNHESKLQLPDAS